MPMQQSHPEVYWRFNVFHRFIHLIMMVTFIGLALTGLPLKYPHAFWAKGLIEHKRAASEESALLCLLG
ncbi:MAG: hypothetical protein A2170_00815 [Deltaproteobacteria bacterium RBG_13_53_10]|nr:MAG: hypothetical protein A2170_00815 [Deltaproteobacteria bacterium RBG_13_53_10]